MSRGGHCDMLGGLGNTEDGPGTLTGTHERRTEHTHVAAAVLRRAGPGAGPGAGDVSAHGAGPAAARSNTQPTREHTGQGSDFYQRMEWARDHSFIMCHEANFSFCSFLHPLRFH